LVIQSPRHLRKRFSFQSAAMKRNNWMASHQSNMTTMITGITGSPNRLYCVRRNTVTPMTTSRMAKDARLMRK